AKLALAAYVRGNLADKPVAAITRADLDAWMHDMVKLPPRLPTGFKNVDMSDPEVQRRRKSSANRIMNNLRAALNLAFEDGLVPSNAEWRRAKPYKGVDAARVRYLTIAEAQRLVNACDPDFRGLVQVALATGARFGELRRLQVHDFNPDSGTLHIRQSKSGKDRHIVLTEEGVELLSGLCAGRAGRAPLLGREWKDNAQILPMVKAVKLAKIDPIISFHGLRHTWASLSVMAGMPLMIVARNLGHVDTTMVERHYGHLAQSYVADAIRKHAPRFGSEQSNVKALR
ncbi:MAG: tyrosine-type recombinase/integrase, partial [Terriglobales bacterium]